MRSWSWTTSTLEVMAKVEHLAWSTPVEERTADRRTARRSDHRLDGRPTQVWTRCRAGGAAASCWRRTPGAAWTAAAARRADQPSRHRGDYLAETLPREYPGAVVFVTHDRRVPSAARHPYRRARSRARSRRGRATTPPFCARRTSGWRTRRCSRRSSTRSSRRRKRGCGRASRRGGRATKAASGR